MSDPRPAAVSAPAGEATLAPCPFCGGEASAEGVVRYAKSRDTWADGSAVREAYFVNCIACGISNQGSVGHQTREKAIAKWNLRSPAPASGAPDEEAKPCPWCCRTPCAEPDECQYAPGMTLLIGALCDAGFTDAGEWGAEAFDSAECATRIADALRTRLAASERAGEAMREDAERWRVWVANLPARETIYIGHECSRYTVTLAGRMTIPEWVDGIRHPRAALTPTAPSPDRED